MPHDTLVSYVNAPASALDAPVAAPLPTKTSEQRQSAPSDARAHRLIHQLFEQQVRRTPDAVAVSYEHDNLTYAQLDERANTLACCLIGKGVKADNLVGICVERSLEMIVGVIGVLKAGGAYVPLDPHYPPDRLAYMLEDSHPRILLTQSHLTSTLPPSTAEVVLLDSDWADISSRFRGNYVPPNLLNQHLAYVIYTSGSTGRPKGVMVEHGNVTRLFASTWSWFGFTNQDVWTLFHSFAFDFSVWELWGALFYGGRVVVVPYLTARSPQELQRRLCEEGVTVLNQTPTAFIQLSSAQIRDRRPQHSLRFVIFGGEALELRVLQAWVERNGVRQPKLINMYGITETTVHVTYRSLSDEDIQSPSGSVIGQPIPDLRIYVLNGRLQSVPIGVAGEIYVGGAGVTRGYLRHPVLTAERFVPDPFGQPSGRMYRTGDIGIRTSDDLKYLGRNDHQVKIRGFRIECGEIEARLAKHPLIRDAAVVARDDQSTGRSLVAYVTRRSAEPSQPHPLNVGELRDYLEAYLPDYMVPGAFVVLEHLPLTPNSKLDRRALPQPGPEAYSVREYEAPQGEFEEALATIWQALLSQQQIGRHDKFFELGGDSLVIVQMLELLRARSITVPLERVFDNTTLAELATWMQREDCSPVETASMSIPPSCNTITPAMLPLVALEQAHIESILEAVPGGASNVKDIYPLVPLQEGILFHHIMGRHSADAYLVLSLLALDSAARLHSFIAALQAVVDRHDALRTAFFWTGLPNPVQVVYRKAAVPLIEHRLDANRPIDEQLGEWLRRPRQEIDVQRAPLIQLEFATDPHSTRAFALLKVHHIVCDNTSRDVFLSEISAQLDDSEAELPQTASFRDHVAQMLGNVRAGDSEAFFRSRLGSIDEPTAPFGLLDVHGDGRDICESHRELSAELAHRTRLQARRLGVSVATLFHAAWALVVARTSNRDDVVFGSVVLGRMQGRTSRKLMLGIFINTLPLRLPLKTLTVSQLVDLTQRELSELLRQEHASLALAQRCSGVPGSAPLFTTLLNYRHAATSGESGWRGTAGVKLLAEQDRTNYPLTLSVDDQREGFAITAQASNEIDPKRICAYLETALQSLVETSKLAPHTPALLLPVVPDNERRQVLDAFNATEAQWPGSTFTHRLIEEQAERSPHAVAIAQGERFLTYGRLNADANRLAHYLRRHGIGPGQFAAVCCERGFEMVVSALAVLKAGAAYIPLDPRYPAQRLAYMLTDAAPALLLTQQKFLPALAATKAQTLLVDTDWSLVSNELAENLTGSPELHAQDLAYVIFTSGSTGMPKGVMVPHQNLVNLIRWNCREFDVHAGGRCSSVAAVAFDATAWETWPPLTVGATLVLAEQDAVTGSESFLQWWAAMPLDVSFLPTPIAELALRSDNLHPTLRTLLVGGDSLRVRPRDSTFSLINNYGPTESTVVATSGSIQCDGGPLHIGKPIANTQIYILGSDLQPTPVDVSGEIYVGGVGVARGYLNRPELSAERFVPHPFSADPNARLYRTGDVGRWRADGTIEYLGRNDFQVKIRGYRIELGEIEAQLARHQDLREVAVLAREDVPGDKCLVAYITIRDGADGRPDELRTFLANLVPAYMVPSAFVILEHLPQTPNGKLDRRALPLPEADAYVHRQYEPPQGSIEKNLSEIWQQLLQIERVGRRDNFFDLGGHSLLAMRLVSHVRQHLGVELAIGAVFDTSTLEQLAGQIGRAILGKDCPTELLKCRSSH